MRALRRAALLLACLALAAQRAAAGAGAGVTPVDDASFEATVLASREAWVLEFASPRCGTCQELAPLYASLAQRHAGLARFGAVDIDTPAGMALARRLDVLSEGVPNIRAWASGRDPEAGARVFTGWQVPPLAELEEQLLQALRAPVRAARRAARRGAA